MSTQHHFSIFKSGAGSIVVAYDRILSNEKALDRGQCNDMNRWLCLLRLFHPAGGADAGRACRNALAILEHGLHVHVLTFDGGNLGVAALVAFQGTAVADGTGSSHRV